MGGKSWLILLRIHFHKSLAVGKTLVFEIRLTWIFEIRLTVNAMLTYLLKYYRYSNVKFMALKLSKFSRTSAICSQQHSQIFKKREKHLWCLFSRDTCRRFYNWLIWRKFDALMYFCYWFRHLSTNLSVYYEVWNPTYS